MRAVSQVEELQGAKDRRRKKGGSKKPSSLFKRGSWVSNLNLGFRTPSSRRTSEVNEPPPLIIKDDFTTRGSQHPGASKALVYAEQSLPKTFESSQLKVETPGLRASRVGDKGRQRESNKILQGEPSWNSRGGVTAETERRSEVRGGRRRACVEDPGQLQWPPGAETKVTEEL